MRTGGELNRSLDNILVPAGASFILGDTNTFDLALDKAAGAALGKPQIRR